MAKWIGNNKAYKRVIKKQLPKVEEIPQENINKEEKPTEDAIKKLMKKAKEKKKKEPFFRLSRNKP